MLLANISMKFPNCLCSINTRQLELLLWRARPNSPTYLQDSTIFFIQLNNMNNEIKSKVLLCYVYYPCHKVAHFLYWVLRPCSPEYYFHMSSAKTSQQLGNYLLSTGEIYGQTTPHICKTLYRSMFDTYQQDNYSVRPRTVHCMEP